MRALIYPAGVPVAKRSIKVISSILPNYINKGKRLQSLIIILSHAISIRKMEQAICFIELQETFKIVIHTQNK